VNGNLFAIFPQNLAGVTGLASGGCVPPCALTANLSTDYRAWRANLKGATEFKSGVLTLTPSLILFGGQTRADQDFREVLHTFGLYSADVSLRWTDWGAMIGLDGQVEVTRMLAFGLGGHVGAAIRDVSLSARDASLYFGFSNPAASSVRTNDDTTALLANAEARVTVKPSSSMEIKAFGGVNYDSRVPAIAAPNVATVILTGSGRRGSPAGIKFDGESSWYAGGGLTVRFGR
jgi:hypothetical protein